MRVPSKPVLKAMAAVLEARARLAQPPPSLTHAHWVEQLRQLCEQHRDSSHKALREVARELLNDWDVMCARSQIQGCR